MLTRHLTIALVATLIVAPGLAFSASAPESKEESIAYYGERYGLADENQKRTNNHGEGDEALYGTRNFREILKGVAYRGGANNRYHRDDRRDNMNPLPQDGLDNLCVEGFGRSYYLYETNFDSAQTYTHCTTHLGEDRTLEYFQLSPNAQDDAYEMLKAVHDTIKDHSNGPVYLHCWNGWHASGLISAKVLRQFCGYSAEEAVAYWDRNTDGYNKEPKYESIRRRIREFQPYPELIITSEEAELICP